MSAATDLIKEAITATASITIQELAVASFNDVLPLDDWPLFQRVEINAEPCELCQAVDGMIIERGSPEDDMYGDQLHINDEFTKVGIGANEVGPDGNPVQPDFHAPPQDLIDKFGHFVRDPDKYAPLRCLPSPEGRDFIVRRIKQETIDEETGEIISKIVTQIDWRVEPYELQ